ncbi:hypothetical protein F8388_007471 [Cannabis sativa]|uniref:Agenet-like domain-containing protein n=1 Tax=Cannabis sativa TaxID=3483 RepID=A0A7J6F4V7_CANSA|nr:hypothetical protein F8388_007471 [Cannabis sativa]
MYSRGDLVEVCSKESGFVGSYHEASIVSQPLTERRRTSIPLFILMKKKAKQESINWVSIIERQIMLEV